MILVAEIRGVLCLVRVTRYQPAVPPVITGPIDRADPGSPAEIEFEVLDLQGRPNRELDRQMDDADVRAVECEIIAAHEDRERHLLEDRAEEHYFEERFS